MDVYSYLENSLKVLATRSYLEELNFGLRILNQRSIEKIFSQKRNEIPFSIYFFSFFVFIFYFFIFSLEKNS